MKILVDTSIWSLALRKTAISTDLAPLVKTFGQLISHGKVAIFGAIRQELLSGIKSAAQFSNLKSYLQAFPDLELDGDDYETAAELFNHCRNHGVQGSHIDFLIAAVAINRNMPVFTLDQDFSHYAKHTKLKLYQAPAAYAVHETAAVYDAM